MRLSEDRFCFVGNRHVLPVILAEAKLALHLRLRVLVYRFNLPCLQMVDRLQLSIWSIPLTGWHSTLEVSFSVIYRLAEPLHCQVHRAYIVRHVSFVVAWASTSPRRLLLLRHNRSHGLVEVVPEGLHTGIVFLHLVLFVAQSDLVRLIVNVRREFLLLQILVDSINGGLLSQVHGRFFS